MAGFNLPCSRSSAASHGINTKRSALWNPFEYQWRLDKLGCLSVALVHIMYSVVSEVGYYVGLQENLNGLTERDVM